ncbi:MAG: alpha/beta hydrolase [Burkholderiales bacterium]
MSRETLFIAGGAGRIETVIDRPAEALRETSHDAARDRIHDAARGVALIAHPHPLHGGTLDNKVVQTLAKTFVELGYVALRPNFRGVGASEGAYDEGNGETEDMLRVAAYARESCGDLPLVLAGFSFGAFVQTRVAKRLQPQRMVLVGLAVGRFHAETVAADTLVIHGELDQTVPLAGIFDWARPQELPIVVIPGADHFFHRRLHLIKSIVKSQWRS